MNIAPEAIALVKEFEGMHARRADGKIYPYPCPAKIPTVGIGTTVWPNGKKEKLSDPPITPQRAEEILAWDLDRKYAPPVDRAVKVPMHPLMRGACISLCYNIGSGAFGRSTALRMINQKRWAEVPRAFKMYRMGGGRVLAGLERRRAAEALMFMAGVKALQAAGPTAKVLPFKPATPAAAAPQQPSAMQRFLSLFSKAA